MATTKTEKPGTATPDAPAKQRKPRTPKPITPLEAQVLAGLNDQKAVTRALRGVAKAVSKLSAEQARTVLGTALEAVSAETTT